MPVGVTDPPKTTAVKITVSPGVDGFGDELNVVVVAKAWTFCTRIVFAALKLASPL